MISLVNSRVTWAPAKRKKINDKIENPGLVQQEQIENWKHADFYAPIGFAFFPFVVSTLGSFGPTAVLCLFSLLTWNYDNIIYSWLVSVFHLCWILLPVLNIEPFAIEKSLLASAKPLPRPP